MLMRCASLVSVTHITVVALQTGYTPSEEEEMATVFCLLLTVRVARHLPIITIKLTQEGHLPLIRAVGKAARRPSVK